MSLSRWCFLLRHFALLRQRSCQMAARRLLFLVKRLCRLKTALMGLVLNSIVRFHVNSFSKPFELAANSIGCSCRLCQQANSDDAVKRGRRLYLSLPLCRNKRSERCWLCPLVFHSRLNLQIECKRVTSLNPLSVEWAFELTRANMQTL